MLKGDIVNVKKKHLQPFGAVSDFGYFFGQPFKLVTDNSAIQLILSNTVSKPPARIERMALRLSQFDFEIEHRLGLSNRADYYSRHPDKACSSAFLEEVKTEQYINLVTYNAMPMSITRADVSAATKSDSEMQALLRWMRSGKYKRQLSELPASYRHIGDKLNVTEDGVLLRGQRILIPTSL